MLDRLVAVLQMSTDVDKPETVVNRIEDANAIGITRCKDDLAIGSQSCSCEFAGAPQLCRNVDKVETVVSKIEDANTIGSIRCKDDLAIGGRNCSCGNDPQDTVGPAIVHVLGVVGAGS